MDVDIPGKSTTGTKRNPRGSGLGLGLWKPFQPAQVLYLRSFMYDSKTSKIMQELFKKILVTEMDPILFFT
jgi:hypothetical protein